MRVADPRQAAGKAFPPRTLCGPIFQMSSLRWGRGRRLRQGGAGTLSAWPESALRKRDLGCGNDRQRPGGEKPSRGTGPPHWWVSRRWFCLVPQGHANTVSRPVTANTWNRMTGSQPSEVFKKCTYFYLKRYLWAPKVTSDPAELGGPLAGLPDAGCGWRLAWPESVRLL